MRKLIPSVCLLLTGMAGMFPCAAQLPWHPEKGFRWAELPVPHEGKAGFTLLSPEQTGIHFTNNLEEHAIAANRVLANGSGVAVGDFDNDGLPDVYFCSLSGHNRLYKNLGNWHFKDVTAAAGVGCAGHVCRGAVFADINGDGRLDLLVSTLGGGVLCFTNRGDGTFADVSESTGLLSHYGAMTLALADVDGNGTLDLFVANSRTDDIHDRVNVPGAMVDGKLVLAPEMQNRIMLSSHGTMLEYGEPSQLYLNDGQGHFTPVSWTNGAFLKSDGTPLPSPPRDWSLTATFRDLNGDGAPDIYVCNDFWSPDRIWINDGKGHFRECPDLAIRHTSGSSMGVDMADVDHDGHPDIFVLDMLSRDWATRKRQRMGQSLWPLPIGAIDNRPQILRNTLLRNRGDGTYEDVAAYSGVIASEWSWQPLFLDVDLDGWEDLLIVAGFHRDLEDSDDHDRFPQLSRSGKLLPPQPGPDGQPLTRSAQEQRVEKVARYYELYTHPLPAPIVAYRNLGNLKFEEADPAWGLTTPGIRNAIALGDFNGDGSLDFVVNCCNSAAEIYRNNTPAPRVAVRLRGLPPNTQGIGAKISLLGGAVPVQTEEVICGGQYLSGSDPMRVFAAGQSTSMTLEVTWRSGKTSTIRQVKPDRLYEIDETSALPTVPAPPVVTPAPLFKDVSRLLAHSHHEEPFDDYARQPLLPYQLSQDGPGVAWLDRGDHHDSLVVGTGRGGALAIYASDGQAGFKSFGHATAAPDDLTGIVGWVLDGGQRAVSVGLSHYESSSHLPSALVLALRTNEAPGNISLPETSSSTGPLAVADVYGDGKLDLFVGGRVIPGRYPEAADSRIYRNVGGQLVLDEENSRVLEKVGLVNGAVWSDLDGDGYPDLILACEWGPIRVFKNQAGHLHEITQELGLDRYTGWWRGVTTGDIDGDGRLDIIASNWGLNSDYQASNEHPLQLYYGDFSDRGGDDLIETVYDPALKAIVPRRNRDDVFASFPYLAGSFPTSKAYAEASLDQILALLPKPAGKVQATTLASTVFFNRTNRFEAVAMPLEAQMAPAFGVNVADFDGDGNEDVFLSQNFFCTQVETPRLDSGRGLLLLNRGGGKLEAVPGPRSGILVYGEQRGSAVGDFDEDGRADIVVTQNGAETKLYQNVGAKPGLRVRLSGPPGNPDGVGATLRLMFGTRPGAAREIHGGSGYWSQDSVVQVMGCPETPTQIWVRWPGGKTTTSNVPARAREISVDIDGKLTADR
ncbi:MAG: VCBS repeat-containing protein [Verrucomicrobiia bacterium]